MSDNTVYLVWAKGTNRFKIGRSYAPSKRLSNMQTASPYELELIAEVDGIAELVGGWSFTLVFMGVAKALLYVFQETWNDLKRLARRLGGHR